MLSHSNGTINDDPLEVLVFIGLSWRHSCLEVPLYAQKDTQMPTNIEIVQDCFAAFQRGDIPAILNMFDDNVERIEPGAPVIPWAGPGKGKASAAEFFGVMGETTDVLKFEPHQYVASGDRVVAVGSWDIRVKATGKSASTDWALDFTLQNGKVTRFQAYLDTAALQAAYTAR